jgi:hypothetical protein
VRGSFGKLQPTREKQIESLKQLCERMKELQPKTTEFTGSEPLVPIPEIETLFSLTQN